MRRVVVYQKENGEFHIKRISFKSDMGINQFDVMYSDYFLRKQSGWIPNKLPTVYIDLQTIHGMLSFR